MRVSFWVQKKAKKTFKALGSCFLQHFHCNFEIQTFCESHTRFHFFCIFWRNTYACVLNNRFLRDSSWPLFVHRTYVSASRRMDVASRDYVQQYRRTALCCICSKLTTGSCKGVIEAVSTVSKTVLACPIAPSFRGRRRDFASAAGYEYHI